MSYSIARSRSGDSTQFVDMVQRCRAAGVDIYVDAVINHMTNYPSPGVGSAGTAYTKYDYPGLYTPDDFHTPCTVTDYSNAANVQDCELLGLPDLNTGLPYVRQTIADYLIKLVRLGVAGFRIDAAKHIQQVELDDILTIVDSTVQAGGLAIPYYFLEISSGPGEALSPRDYYGEAYRSGGAADITEFTFQGVGDKFLGTGGQHISQLDPNGLPGSQFSAAAWGLMPSDKAVVFLENHDTQHDAGRISYRDGQTFRLANVWMLAQPYGYPKILSNYAFSRPLENSKGPPSDANGITLPVSCASSLEAAADGSWVCRTPGSDDRGDGGVPARGGRHADRRLVGRRRQRDRLLTRRQGIRGDQPRDHGDGHDRGHGDAAGQLLRPAHRRAGRHGVRRRRRGGGLHRGGSRSTGRQFSDRDRRREPEVG